jgi:hypothetical protein
MTPNRRMLLLSDNMAGDAMAGLHLLVQWGRGQNEVKFALSRGVGINAADECGRTIFLPCNV